MFRNPASAPRGSRTSFVGVLLVAALALSAALAWQAVDAGRSHEAVARDAVGEQTLFAAWEFTNQARQRLEDKLLKPGLDVVARHGGKDPAMPLTHPDTPDGDWGSWVTFGPPAAGAFFRVTWPAGEIVTAGPADPGLRAWLSRDLADALAGDPEERWDVLIVDPGDGMGLIAYGTLPEGEPIPEVVIGFRVKEGGLAGPLSYAFEGGSFLPEALTRGRGNAELFSVGVNSSSGSQLWSTERRFNSPFTATDTLGAVYGGLVTTMVLNPAQAESLTIGGFPSSRMPVALGLLILTGGLVAAAFFQLRREAELSRLRADFVSGVSHELRTPLAQIRMFAETLLLGRVRTEEERLRSLQIIVNESQRLTHQVGNVLLYSQSERERINVSRESIDVGDLVDEVAEVFRPLATKAKAHLSVTTTPGLVAEVDGELVRQVLLNLLDNATKYGPAGQTIVIGAGHAPGSRVLLWVEDEGPGIAQEDRSRIWEPYYRLSRDRGSAVAGSGIGLAVVRQIMDALGGVAGVESADGGGTRFVLEIPIGGDQALGGQRDEYPSPAPQPAAAGD